MTSHFTLSSGSVSQSFLLVAPSELDLSLYPPFPTVVEAVTYEKEKLLHFHIVVSCIIFTLLLFTISYCFKIFCLGITHCLLIQLIIAFNLYAYSVHRHDQVTILTNSCTHYTKFMDAKITLKILIKSHINTTPTCFGTQRNHPQGASICA